MLPVTLYPSFIANSLRETGWQQIWDLDSVGMHLCHD